MMNNNIQNPERSDRELTSYTNLVNATLEEYLEIGNKYFEPVVDAMQYSVENGGKRLRPILVLEFCRMCGGNISDALPFACALEMIHTYSLIHDDLPCMDNDDYRRGKEACHIKYGYDFALLAGDALLTYAFQIASDAGVSPQVTARCIRSLSNYAGIYGMIGGQTLDIKNEGKKTLTIEELEYTHKHKTGALIRCACEMGCTVACASNEEYDAARTYAENLGLAFQIVDDILDAEEDKSIGKITFVTLLGIEEAERLAEKYTENALRALDTFKDSSVLKQETILLLTRNK